MSGARVRDYGRSECRDGHSFRAIDARSVHVLDECRRCGHLRFLGRGLDFNARWLDCLLLGPWAPEDDDRKLKDYPPVRGDETLLFERVSADRWAIKLEGVRWKSNRLLF